MSNDADATEFHIFVDTSGLAYGAVCYVKIVSNSGKIATCLVCSKTKVAPLKVVTIPRLELMAATLGVQLGQIVSKALNFSMNSFNFWTDSVTVNGAEVANSRKVKCRSTRFRLRQIKRTIITKEII